MFTVERVSTKGDHFLLQLVTPAHYTHTTHCRILSKPVKYLSYTTPAISPQVSGEDMADKEDTLILVLDVFWMLGMPRNPASCCRATIKLDPMKPIW